jgi:nucleotide-binding universal stress UspA family protein
VHVNLLAFALVWAAIVVLSMIAVTYLATRWGRDAFGWALLTAVLGPIALVGLVGTRQSDILRPEPFEHLDGGAGAAHGERVLLACDGSAPVVRAAQRLARMPGVAEAVLLIVLPHEALPRDAGSRAEHDHAVEAATGASLGVLRTAGVPARVVVGYGVPGEEILRCAGEEQAGTILVGRRGNGLTKALLGSVSGYVVKHASQPVLVVD